MNKKFIKRIMCSFLIGVLILNGIFISLMSSNDLIVNAEEYKTLFIDDFNDNIKDMTKWSELYSNGTWEETNGRAEFNLTEGTNGEHKRGIESKEIPISISENDDVIFSCEFLSDIDHYEWQWVGQLIFEIRDQEEFIKIRYKRYRDVIEYVDSIDNEWVEIKTRGDGIWTNQIQLFSNKYRIKSDGEVTDYIENQVFSSNNPDINIRIYTILEGDYEEFWWIGGFDNVVVTTTELPTVNINSPDDTISGVYRIVGTAYSSISSIDFVEIKVDNDNWIRANGKENWYYDIDTDLYDKGSHLFSARSYDGNAYSIVRTITINIIVSDPIIKIERLVETWHNKDIFINGIASSENGEITNLSYRIDGGDWISFINGYNENDKSWHFLIDISKYNEGWRNVEIKAIDNIGQEAKNDTGFGIDVTCPFFIDIERPRRGCICIGKWERFTPIIGNLALCIGPFNVLVDAFDNVADLKQMNVNVLLKNGDRTLINKTCTYKNNFFDIEYFEAFLWRPCFSRECKLIVTVEDMAHNTKTSEITIAKFF